MVIRGSYQKRSPSMTRFDHQFDAGPQAEPFHFSECGRLSIGHAADDRFHAARPG